MWKGGWWSIRTAEKRRGAVVKKNILKKMKISENNLKKSSEKVNTKSPIPRKSPPRRGRPRKESTWTAELLRERAEQYFKKCDARTVATLDKDGNVVQMPKPLPYSVEGLCCALAICRSVFQNWRRRDDDMGRAADMIHQRIMADRIEGALEGRQNASFAQFMLKNNSPDDYRDRVEVENRVDDRLGGILEGSIGQWVSRLKN